MSRRRLPRTRADEGGSVLVMTLVFVVVVGIAGASILDMQAAMLRGSTNVTDRVERTRAADRALDLAIGLMRDDIGAGRDAPNGSACNDPGALESLGTFEGVTVRCRPSNGSGGRSTGLGSEPPDAAIVTYGGLAADGNDTADTSAPDARIPFCDDWHTRAPECEAGLYVGRGVDGNTLEDGGLYVADNGRDGDGPLVRSNSSIVVKDDISERALKVAGDITARRGCTASRVYAGWVSASQFDNSRRHCDTAPGAGATVPEPPPGWTTRTPTMTLRDDLFRTHVGRCPASQYLKLEPGRYTDVAAINAVMQTCKDMLYWFTPGTYYFDFHEPTGSVKPAWKDPAGFTQIVGGSRVAAASEPNQSAWNDCVCRQPDKLLVTNKTDATRWTGTNLADTQLIDGRTSTSNVDGREVLVQQNKLETPLPTDPTTTTIHNVWFEIAHSAPTTAAYRPGYPRVRIQNVGGSCTVPLTTGAEFTQSAPQAVDLTDGCPIDVPGTTRASNFPDAHGDWTPAMVNSLQATYEANSTAPTSVVLDGMRFRVRYDGRPAPSYPAGCDDTAAGVQFVFGNDSRMYFDNNDVYVELCASNGRRDGADNDHAIAIQGVDEAAAPPARQYATSTEQPALTADPRQPIAFFPADDLARFNAIGDGRYAVTPPWTNGDAARVAYRLPRDVVPAGSTITNVTIRVRHAEGPAGFLPAARVGPSLRIVPGSPGTGSNRLDADTFNADAVPSGPVDRRLPWCLLSADQVARSITPLSTPSDRATYLDQQLQALPCWTDPWTHGARSTAALDWPSERLATDSLNTPEAWNGALVVYEVPTVSGGPKLAVLDGIEITVSYRPPDSLRPLRGCLTIRPATRPFAPAGPGDPAAYTEANGLGMVGTDTDWGVPGARDEAYHSGQGDTDVPDCALVKIGRDVKFHVEGMIYAPTAAVDLAGNDNDAPWARDGIHVRHLTAFRWRNGGGKPGIGGEDAKRDDREVTLQAVDGAGRVLQERTVRFVDNQGRQPGATVRTTGYRRRP